MKHLIFIRFCAFFALLGLLFGQSACNLGERGRGDLVTETRPETNFHALDIRTSGDVEVRTGPVFLVELTCEENIMPYLETEVEDGVLKLYFTRNVYDVDGLRIRVTAPAWDGFEVSGSADVRVKDDLEGSDLDLFISGSGSIGLPDLAFDRVDVTVSGSGDIEMDGLCDLLNCTISGSGEMNALDFWANDAKVTISGSGEALLGVHDFLDATISGSGDIGYKGNPQVVNHISGSGRLYKL